MWFTNEFLLYFDKLAYDTINNMNLSKITHIQCGCRKESEGQVIVCSIIYLYTIHLLSMYLYLHSIIHSSRGLDISNKLSECYHRESDALFLGWLEKWLLLSRLWTSDTWWPRIFLDINLECPLAQNETE